MIIIIQVLAYGCYLVNQQDWSRQSSLCKFNPYNRVPLLQVSTLFFLWADSKQPPLPLFLSPLPPSSRVPGHSLGAPQSQQTSFPAIRLTSPRMALVSSCTMLFSPTCWSPLKALFERLLLAVLQHWDPSEKTSRGIRNTEHLFYLQ